MIAREIAHVRAQVDQHVAQYAREKAANWKALTALADEAGAETGKPLRELNELKAQVAEQKTAIEEARGEISQLRAQASACVYRKPHPIEEESESGKLIR